MRIYVASGRFFHRRGRRLLFCTATVAVYVTFGGDEIRVYIAGPYSALSDYEIAANVMRAIDAGIAIAKRGHTPYIPHLTHFVELRSQEIGAGLQYEDYMRMDEAWLACADALLYLAPSPGADRELTFALANHLTVFQSVNDIPIAVTA